MRRWFRWWHWLRAHVCGYFWLPCPICNRYFGGHEHGASLMTSWGSGFGTCADPACKAEAQRRNTELMAHYSLQMQPNGGYIPLYDGVDERVRFPERFPR